MEKTANMLIKLRLSEDDVHDFLGQEVTVIPHTKAEREKLLAAIESIKAIVEASDNPTAMQSVTTILAFFGRARVTSHGEGNA